MKTRKVPFLRPGDRSQARPLRVRERKLGKGVLGYCHDDGMIEIDPRQTPQDFLDTLVHEILHHQFPDLSEDAVLRVAPVIARTLWAQGYRRVIL